MEIPINEKVICADGNCGSCIGVILNPLSQELTHIIVQIQDVSATKVLVPVDMVSESTPLHLNLNCARLELAKLEPFVESRFIPASLANYPHLPTGYEPESTWLWPYTLADEEQFGHYEAFERIPHGELAVHRGSQVMATDGPVGYVEEFIVTPYDHQLTHLVLREKDLWGENDLTVPITAVARIEDDLVYVNLDKRTLRRQK
jgi:sporulation protein YlmC with PRC-barrel domain